MHWMMIEEENQEWQADSDRDEHESGPNRRWSKRGSLYYTRGTEGAEKIFIREQRIKQGAHAKYYITNQQNETRREKQSKSITQTRGLSKYTPASVPAHLTPHQTDAHSPPALPHRAMVQHRPALPQTRSRRAARAPATEAPGQRPSGMTKSDVYPPP